MSRNYKFFTPRYREFFHNNPVEEGLVFKPEDYVCSSARDYSGEHGLVDNVIVVDLY
jgi:hypothetical protein